MSEEKGRGGLARARRSGQGRAREGSGHGVRPRGRHVVAQHDVGLRPGRAYDRALQRDEADVFVPGNHEFDFGKDVFLKRMAEAKFPVFAANMRERGRQRRCRASRTSDHLESAACASASSARRWRHAGDLATRRPEVRPAGRQHRLRPRRCARSGRRLRRGASSHTDRDTDCALVRSRAVDVLLTGHDHDLRVDYDGKTAHGRIGEEREYVVVIDLSLDLDGEGAGARWLAAEFRIVDTATVDARPRGAGRSSSATRRSSTRSSTSRSATLTVELDSRNTTVRTRRGGDRQPHRRRDAGSTGGRCRDHQRRRHPGQQAIPGRARSSRAATSSPSCPSATRPS